MYIPKRYGQSRVESCPFCSKSATTNSSEGVPVCQAHKNEKLPDMKCVCGSFLELRKGKFGAFFSCIKCGNVNFSKAMEVNVVTPAAKAAVKEKAPEKPRAPKETIVRSDELDFLY